MPLLDLKSGNINIYYIYSLCVFVCMFLVYHSIVYNCNTQLNDKPESNKNGGH